MRHRNHCTDVLHTNHNHQQPVGAHTLLIQTSLQSFDSPCKALHYCILPKQSACYRPKFAKVMFYTCLSVILFTGGKYLGKYTPSQVLPPGRYPPSRQVHPRLGRYTPRAGTPLPGRCIPRRGRYTPPRAGTPLPSRYTPLGQLHLTLSKYVHEKQVQKESDESYRSPLLQCY